MRMKLFVLCSICFVTSFEDEKPNWLIEEDFEMARLLEKLNITDLRPRQFRNMTNAEMNVEFFEELFYLQQDVRLQDTTYEFMSAVSVDVKQKWPNATIPYEVDSRLSSKLRAVVAMAMVAIQNVSCVRFVPSKKYNGPNWVKALQVNPSNLSICSASMATNFPNKPDIALSSADYCATKHSVLHELVHVLGFTHEQEREDRDEFITINFDNINDNFKDQFFKYTKQYNFTVITPYDYNSIMHYANYAFTKKRGLLTMVSKTSTKVPAQRNPELSRWDIVKINKYYNCGEKLAGCQDKQGESWCKTNGLGMAANGKMFPASAKCVDTSWSKDNCLKTCGDCFNQLAKNKQNQRGSHRS